MLANVRALLAARQVGLSVIFAAPGQGNLQCIYRMWGITSSLRSCSASGTSGPSGTPMIQ
jgi:hypothetical protein